MELNEYQAAARQTAVWKRGTRLVYCLFGLIGEAGEVANKFKKSIRDDDEKLTDERKQAMLEELGDTLWYLAMVADELDTTLEAVALMNVVKLSDRFDRGVIKGSGDYR